MNASLDPSDARLLVVTLSNIGDVVMTTPVLEALAKHFPDAKIDLLADPRSAELVKHAPYIGNVWLRDKRAAWPAQLRLLKAIRRSRYALVVDLRTPLIGRLVRAKQRLFKPAREGPAQHAVDEHFAALRPLLGDRAPPCKLYLSEQHRSQASRLLAELPGSRYLCIAPGANWPGKRWPLASYQAMVNLQSKNFDAVIVVGGRGDLDTRVPLNQFTLPAIDLSDRTDLLTAAAVIEQATAFVGNDSGLGHIAAAIDVPTLTVFGPGDPQRYRPRGSRAQVAYAPDADLTKLDPKMVSAELERLLDR